MPALVDDFPTAVVPAGWSPEAVASILRRLPKWQDVGVCLWAVPSFPPDAIDGDSLRELPADEQEWHGLRWSAERWRTGWIDVFPSQMRSRKPEDEILRQWSGAVERRLFTDAQHLAFTEAFLLEAEANPPIEPWEAVTRALFLEPFEDLRSTLRPWPICTTLVNRKLRWFFEDHLSTLVQELRDRMAKVEEEISPLARASLRARIAQNQPAAVAEAAVRLLLIIGERADADALRAITTIDLRQWPVTASCMDFLADMPWLQSLDLSDAWFNSGREKLGSLSVLTGLKKLALAGIDLHNSDLRFLRGLVSLEVLDLSRNDGLSDGCTSTLVRLPSLRKLDLRSNRSFSEECKQILRNRLPGCEILFEGK
ncbi:MAG: leucine-rich repeat domain-containing protein [Planctomycetes bacterium]|nr:leucine-rich repeat domain-containing protein [Planctomycetota bacterium]